ncbi:hypothetical protein PCANC_28647 [Puccinia coronata f. sp. avenae]|uniref:Uncharacterized protein n=1 Tax=Puccinia coronata f. sp. avenae TaxID=200324 RepID=A0A2N5S0L6_9BASI|nr:hypothetical protein PCANC_28647 [Puccinia coronata f. sp. avenae]
MLPSGKVVDTYRPPQQTKRAFDKLGSTHDAVPKKSQTTGAQAKPHRKLPLSVTAATQKAPLASSSCHRQPTSHTTTQSPSTPQSGPTSNPDSKTSPQEMYRLKLNTLTSALVALRQIVAALWLVKGQQEMAKRATFAKLVDFVCDSCLLVRMLNGSPLGLESSPLPEVTWASQPDGAGGEGGKIQSLAMVQEGWEFCKLILDILNNPQAKHKAKFCTDLSRVFLKLFKQRCYGVWNTVEEACPSLGKRKQNRW